tara:strand:+ start:75 stop:458 length:384 start_codon:yes stop_codon:yes gene_type:complete
MQVSQLEIKDEHDTVLPDATLVDASKKILQLARGVLVVVDEGKPLGTLSDSHILTALSKSLDCRKEACKDHMDTNILSVNLTDNVKDILVLMKMKKPTAVVVVDESQQFIGYFSPNDYREALSSLSS